MRLFLFTLLCCTAMYASAQTAIIRHNTVILGNEELFKLYSVGTFTHQTYKVKNLQEDDLILIDQTTLRNDQGTILMKFLFNSLPDAEAYIPMNVNFKKQLARLLANYGVVKNNKLDIAAVDIFCKNYNLKNYPSKYIADEISGSGEVKKEIKREVRNEVKQVKEIKEEKVPDEIGDINNENTEEKTDVQFDENGLVKRDVSQQIYLSGSKIRQDYKEIGSYKSETKMLLGQEGKQITLYALNGDKVAIARYINGDEQCELMTTRDNKTWNIPIPKGDIYMVVKDLVKVLADKMYL